MGGKRPAPATRHCARPLQCSLALRWGGLRRSIWRPNVQKCVGSGSAEHGARCATNRIDLDGWRRPLFSELAHRAVVLCLETGMRWTWRAARCRRSSTPGESERPGGCQHSGRPRHGPRGILHGPGQIRGDYEREIWVANAKARPPPASLRQSVCGRTPEPPDSLDPVSTGCRTDIRVRRREEEFCPKWSREDRLRPDGTG